jgi:hypothetical protein
VEAAPLAQADSRFAAVDERGQTSEALNFVAREDI